MKLKNLSIILAITLSPIINAWPVKWIKDNAVRIAIGVAGISAAVIYISQSDNDIKEEADNHSPRNEQFNLENKALLKSAREQAELRLSRESAHQKSVYKEPKSYTNKNGDQVFEFSEDTKLERKYNPTATATKSALKKHTHEILIDRSQISQ